MASSLSLRALGLGTQGAGHLVKGCSYIISHALGVSLLTGAMRMPVRTTGASGPAQGQGGLQMDLEAVPGYHPSWRKTFRSSKPQHIMVISSPLVWGLPGGSVLKTRPAMQETRVRFLGWGKILEGHGNHPSILASENPMDLRSLVGYGPSGHRVGYD